MEELGANRIVSRGSDEPVLRANVWIGPPETKQQLNISDHLRWPAGEAPPPVGFRDDLLRLPAGQVPPPSRFRDDLLRLRAGEELPPVRFRDDLIRVPGGEEAPRVLFRDGELLPPVEVRNDLLRTRIPEPRLVVDIEFTDGSKRHGTEYSTEVESKSDTGSDTISDTKSDTTGDIKSDIKNSVKPDVQQFDKNPLPELGIIDNREILYKDGSRGSLTLRRELSAPQVDQFFSPDGVKYKRVDLNAEDRAILASKLGHEPPPGLSAWVVEGGGIRKSNGNSDRKIIASISFDEDKRSVNVKTVWPVPQETNYNSDGSFVHSFPNGAKQTTTFGPDGQKSVVQEWPGGAKKEILSSKTAN